MSRRLEPLRTSALTVVGTCAFISRLHGNTVTFVVTDASAGPLQLPPAQVSVARAGAPVIRSSDACEARTGRAPVVQSAFVVQGLAESCMQTPAFPRPLMIGSGAPAATKLTRDAAGHALYSTPSRFRSSSPSFAPLCFRIAIPLYLLRSLRYLEPPPGWPHPSAHSSRPAQARHPLPHTPAPP